MASGLTGKKVIITGGAGFIGHNLALKIKQMGATTRSPQHESYRLLDIFDDETASWLSDDCF
jgi:nucleoside-diphosphate-sugar epimerase